MRVLLINAPVRLNARPNCIPYGLATIASVLRAEGHSVDLFDVNALRPEFADVERFLASRRWDLVGLSGLITTYAWQKRIAAVLRERQPGAFLVSGGGLATCVPEFALEKIALDAAVLGEGERTMAELAAGKRPVDVDGLALRDGDGVKFTNPRRNIADLDTVPYPAWDLLPMDVYLKNPIWGGTAANSSGFPEDVKVERSMNVISSRGCPYSCKFCYHLFGRGRYRFRSAENIAGEVDLLVRDYGVDFIGFVDDNFMASRRLVSDFCELLGRRNYKVRWGCHGRVDSARPEVLRQMRDAGCVWIGYGVESGSPKILKAMGKQTSVEQAEAAILAARDAGIFANATFIYGYPGEDEQTVRETLEFKRRLGINVTSFYATPYPGTPLFEEHTRHRIADMEGFIESLGNATDFVINLTDFSDKDFHRFTSIGDGLAGEQPAPR